MTTLDPDQVRERADLVLAVPLARALGLVLLDENDPAAGVGLVVGELAGNGVGSAHAAALSAGLELAAYLALAPYLAPSEHAVTHMATLTLVAPAKSGDRVTLRGVVDRRTGRLGFVGAVATVGEEVVARASITKSVVPFEPARSQPVSASTSRVAGPSRL